MRLQRRVEDLLLHGFVGGQRLLQPREQLGPRLLAAFGSALALLEHALDAVVIVFQQFENVQGRAPLSDSRLSRPRPYAMGLRYGQSVARRARCGAVATSRD